jgi:hypothetical protein
MILTFWLLASGFELEVAGFFSNLQDHCRLVIHGNS